MTIQVFSALSVMQALALVIRADEHGEVSANRVSMHELVMRMRCDARILPDRARGESDLKRFRSRVVPH